MKFYYNLSKNIEIFHKYLYTNNGVNQINLKEKCYGQVF